MVGFILNRIANITGTTISVSIVAKPRPAIIVITMESKNASNISATKPRIVVIAAILRDEYGGAHGIQVQDTDSA
ncbi:hypothetical protein SU60_00780 [Vibrio mytili]|uniref:Uncharacterized protein n=1 Tax=Vibrio mytili TaxID=50718 RepID=A0A0C3HVS3_9VIBR|nr:hypothetical protein SU60_00780 [Vibrio mytili]